MDNIDVLMRQTNYTKEKCIEMLKTNTLEECISIFLDIQTETKEENLSTNQKIFKAIREEFHDRKKIA
tara:strand:+ start:348 stop:551 length:204 start_codon:yes stop_codon:yes gene_type:complete